MTGTRSLRPDRFPGSPCSDINGPDLAHNVPATTMTVIHDTPPLPLHRPHRLPVDLRQQRAHLLRTGFERFLHEHAVQRAFQVIEVECLVVACGGLWHCGDGSASLC